VPPISGLKVWRHKKTFFRNDGKFPPSYPTLYSKYKFLHNDHCESHIAHISLYKSQSSDAGVLFSLTNIVWFLLVASLIIQNVMQSAHAYRRFRITAGSKKNIGQIKQWPRIAHLSLSSQSASWTFWIETGDFVRTLLTSVRRQLTCLSSLAFPYPLSWYHEHSTQYIEMCTTTTRPPIVSGTLTRDASAVLNVNKGSMQLKHTNWTGWTAGRRL